MEHPIKRLLLLLYRLQQRDVLCCNELEICNVCTTFSCFLFCFLVTSANPEYTGTCLRSEVQCINPTDFRVHNRILFWFFCCCYFVIVLFFFCVVFFYGLSIGNFSVTYKFGVKQRQSIFFTAKLHNCSMSSDTTVFFYTCTSCLQV